MKTSTLLLLGSCLLLQAVPSKYSRGVASDRVQLNVPLYHHQQSRELLGLAQNTNDRTIASVARQIKNDSHGEIIDSSLSLALYIDRRTTELLPESYKEDGREVAQALIQTANRYEMDPLFLMAVIQQESRFRPTVIGRHGEVGLMQIKPSTALWMLENDDIEDITGFTGEPNLDSLREALKDPVTNIAFGAAYLARLRSTFKGRGPLYLSAYNMGAMNLKSKLRNGQRPRIYSDLVLEKYTRLSLDFRKSQVIPTRAVASMSKTFGL